MLSIEIQNDYIFNTFEEIKQKIYLEQNVMLSNDDLLLFLMANNLYITLSEIKSEIKTNKEKV